jgi:hypothetical protein
MIKDDKRIYQKVSIITLRKFCTHENTRVLSGIALCTIAGFLVTAMVATMNDALGAKCCSKY